MIMFAMRTLKTSEAAALLNVSPNTLRAWERRFGYPKPQRSAGRHRLYTHGEVAALRDALQQGLSISSAVSRAREALSTDTHTLVGALAGFELDRADSAMEAALALRSVERSVEEVLLPSLAELGERRQQHLLDGTLHRAQRERRLHRAVGAVELEAGERADEGMRVGAQRLTRAADGGRDRQPLLQGVAQRRDLPVRVQAVTPGGPLRLGVTETTLPCTQGVGADIQQGRSFARLKGPHREHDHENSTSAQTRRIENCTGSHREAEPLGEGSAGPTILGGRETS